MQAENSPFFVVGGTVPSDAPCYVTRQADADLFSALQNAVFCFVLDTRQVGKSSLMARTAERLRASNVRVALLDLTALGKEDNAENWHYGLLERIGQELGCLRALRAFWEANSNLPLTQRFMQAIEQVALEKEPTPLVLAIDEIDFVRSLPFDTDDFFTGIRECHNRRANQPALKRLTFCLIGSATPNDLIQNVHITPFNVGRRVTITDFTEQEAQPLAEGLTAAGKDGDTLLAQILYWTSGHPYLTQRLCATAAQSPEVGGAGDIDQLVKRLFLSRRASVTDDLNLTFVRDRLQKSDLDKDKLFGLYQTIHDEKRVVADDPRDPYCSALRLSGIVTERDGFLFVRNRVYRELFSREWAQEQMPGIEAARRRREVRRARLQIGSVAAAIVLALSVLTGLALRYADLARSQEKESQHQTQIAREQTILAERNAQLARQGEADATAAKLLADANAEKAETNAKRESHARKAESLATRSALLAKQRADAEKRKANHNFDVARARSNALQRALAKLHRANKAEAVARRVALLRLHEAQKATARANHLAIVANDNLLEREMAENLLGGREVLALKGHIDHITSVRLSLDGRRILTVFEDGTAKMWDWHSDVKDYPKTPAP